MVKRILSLDEEVLREFEHTFNPLHMLGWFNKMGMPVKEAKEIIIKYEVDFYKPLGKYHLYR